MVEHFPRHECVTDNGPFLRAPHFLFSISTFFSSLLLEGTWPHDSLDGLALDHFLLVHLWVSTKPKLIIKLANGHPQLYIL